MRVLRLGAKLACTDAWRKAPSFQLPSLPRFCVWGSTTPWHPRRAARGHKLPASYLDAGVPSPSQVFPAAASDNQDWVAPRRGGRPGRVAPRKKTLFSRGTGSLCEYRAGALQTEKTKLLRPLGWRRRSVAVLVPGRDFVHCPFFCGAALNVAVRAVIYRGPLCRPLDWACLQGLQRGLQHVQSVAGPGGGDGEDATHSG